MGFIIGIGIGLVLLVGAVGYLYSTGSTLIWTPKKKV